MLCLLLKGNREEWGCPHVVRSADDSWWRETTQAATSMGHGLTSTVCPSLSECEARHEARGIRRNQGGRDRMVFWEDARHQ